MWPPYNILTSSYKLDFYGLTMPLRELATKLFLLLISLPRYDGLLDSYTALSKFTTLRALSILLFIFFVEADLRAALTSYYRYVRSGVSRG